MPRVAILNPNTNAATTATMVEIAELLAYSSFEFVGVTVANGPALIVEPTALAAAADEVAALAPQFGEFDAVIVAAFGDPGRDRLEKLLPSNIPVVGIGEASMREAARLSTGCFAVATIYPGLKEPIRHLATACGCGAALANVRTTEGDASALMVTQRGVWREGVSSRC